VNESAHGGADTDESTGRELWQIRPVETCGRGSSCTCPFSPLHNRYCGSKSGKSNACVARLAAFRVSLRRSPCLLRCGRGIRTHTAGRLRRPRKPARREWRPEGATSPAGRTDGSPAGRWLSISCTCGKVTRECLCTDGRAVNGGDTVCR
jgi:hypothetical protein